MYLSYQWSQDDIWIQNIAHRKLVSFDEPENWLACASLRRSCVNSSFKSTSLLN